MRNLKLLIEYDGSRYAGWQIQNQISPKILRLKKKTIQGEIEKVLKKILDHKVRLIGVGRTDAGVHAQGYVANFKTTKSITPISLQKALNGLLPGDIVVYQIKEVSSDFHSRFDAKSKTYRYSVVKDLVPSAIGRDYVYYFPFKISVSAMQKGAKYLIGKHNFSSFISSGNTQKNPNCTIFRLDVKNSRKTIDFYIEANYFLYRMARNIIGTLLEVGRGKILPSELKKILSFKDRQKAGPTAPAKGLCLIKVKY